MVDRQSSRELTRLAARSMDDKDPEKRRLAASVLSQTQLEPKTMPKAKPEDEKPKNPRTIAEDTAPRSKSITIESVPLFKELTKMRMEDKFKAVMINDDLSNENQVILSFDNGDKVYASVEEIELKASFNELASYVANQVMTAKR
jgi:hypothetical protein